MTGNLKDFKYTIENNEIIINNYIGNAEVLIVPDDINGIPVTVIGTLAFNLRGNLKSITLPVGIDILKYGAFNGCINLESIILPKSIYLIETYAFNNCYGLKNIEIHNHNIKIESDSFYNCHKLKIDSLDPLTQKILKKNRVEL